MSEEFVVESLPLASIKMLSRQRMEYGDITDLADSIKTDGLINPIGVRKSNGEYILSTGGRRLLAVTSLGWETVPCHIYEEGMDDITIERIELHENIKRKSLTWSEEVQAVKRLHDLYVTIHGPKVLKTPDAPGHSQQDTAKMLGISPQLMSRYMQVASDVEAVPELAQCKTMDEAVKTSSKIKEAIVVKELSSRIDKGTMTIDEKKQFILRRFVVGDFFEGAKSLPSDHFHFIECDPPYGVDYNTQDRGVKGRELDTKDYNEVESSSYVEFLDKLIKELYRVMSPNGWLVFWYADEPWGEVVYQALIRANFIVPRHHPLWYKGTGQTMAPQVRLAGDYASFYYCRKGPAVIAKEGHGLVFAHSPLAPQKKTHPTERPVKLIQEIIETFVTPSSRVLIPFLGSGASLLASINAKMDPIGFELSKEYKDKFSVRVLNSEYGKFE